MIIDPYRWHRLSVLAVTPVANATVAVTFKRPSGYQFKAGQYAVARIMTPTGEQYVRQYSLSSAPDDAEIELLIQQEPGGSASSWFCQKAGPGDIVELSQPFGGFTLEDSNRPVLLIAGGVGVAPFLSMLRSKSRASLSLLYSVRSREQVCFAKELTNYHATIVYTGQTSRINAEMLGTHLSLNPLVYICGSKRFVDGMLAVLQDLGTPLQDIRRELFTLQ